MFGAWAALEVVVITGQRFGVVLWTLAHLVFLFFFAGMEIGFLRICVDVCKGEEPVYRDAFRHLALGPQFLAGQLLYVLMVLAGLALFIVPGVLLGGRYGLFGFFMAGGEPNVIRSFQQSGNLTAGRQPLLFAIFLGILIFNVLGACLLGVGVLITLPMSGLVCSSVYRQLTVG